MIYLDSCIVIYLVEGDSFQARRVRAVLEAANEAKLAVSWLVRLECLVGPYKANDSGLIERYHTVFDSLITLPITGPAFDRAAQLRAWYGLKTPDALHLAVAQGAGCDGLWTNDARLSRAAGDFAINITT